MIDWAQRIEESRGRDDGSLAFRAAAQADAAITRARDRWGERGVPFQLRGAGPAPEAEWVWLGAAVAETAAGRSDLDSTPSLLAFRIREESPLEAAMRLDRFRVAYGLPADTDARWLEPSGDPYLARPAERLLDYAYDGWEGDLEERLRGDPDQKPPLFGRGRWLRRRRSLAHRAINEERLERYVRLVTTAYAPEAVFRERAEGLPREDRLELFETIVDQRGHLLSAEDLVPFLDDLRSRPRALELARRLRELTSASGRALG